MKIIKGPVAIRLKLERHAILRLASRAFQEDDELARDTDGLTAPALNSSSCITSSLRKASATSLFSCGVADVTARKRRERRKAQRAGGHEGRIGARGRQARCWPPTTFWVRPMSAPTVNSAGRSRATCPSLVFDDPPWASLLDPPITVVQQRDARPRRDCHA